MYFLQGDYNEVKKYCDGLFFGDYFEFEFAYVSENEKFREIDRFLWESRHEHTRYRNSYNGNFVIGFNEWLGNTPNKHFDAFMFFLQDYLERSRSCIMFTETTVEKPLLEAIEKHFNVTLKELNLTDKKDTALKKIGFCIEVSERKNDDVRS